ncbi:hypothetical protein [Streptomyces sp. cg2]|uniref:hypothetical protein n=1 Tax=Streptomyces sp. cg2 TaxID=3238799 RepID=UPI0034E2E184
MPSSGPVSQASHSTWGDIGEDSEAAPPPGSDACAGAEADAAADDFGEYFGARGDGPDAWAPPPGDAEPPGGRLGGALGEPGAGALGDGGGPGRDGEGRAGPEEPPGPGAAPCPGPGSGPDGRAGRSGAAGTVGEADGTALGDAPASSPRPFAASPPAGRPGPWPVRRCPPPRPSALGPARRGAPAFPSPGRAALPDGAGRPGSLTLMQPASAAASAETVTAAAVTRAAERAPGRRAGALVVDGSAADGGRGGIGHTGGTSGIRGAGTASDALPNSRPLLEDTRRGTPAGVGPPGPPRAPARRSPPVAEQVQPRVVTTDVRRALAHHDHPPNRDPKAGHPAEHDVRAVRGPEHRAGFDDRTGASLDNTPDTERQFRIAAFDAHHVPGTGHEFGGPGRQRVIGAPHARQEPGRCRTMATCWR